MSTEIATSSSMTLEKCLQVIDGAIEDEDAALRSSIKTFRDFVYTVFAKSFEGEFIGGDFVDEICERFDNKLWTMDVGPRDHFKSTRLYARVMYRLWNSRDKDNENHYFSYNKPLSVYHIRKIKNMIIKNPHFNRYKDAAGFNATGLLKYTTDGIHFFTLDPHGLLSFKRGIHCDGVFVDDPFQDPKNKMNLSSIDTINEIFASNIMSMCKEEGEFRVVGTAQTNQDFLFDPKYDVYFDRRVSPALINESPSDAGVLWPEFRPYALLQRKKQAMGTRLFNQEYMCSPAYSEDIYFKREQIMLCVNSQIKNLKKLDTTNDVILGWDLGKKLHPSHIVIFEKSGQRLLQVYQTFLDGVDYCEQVALVKQLWERFGITKGYYDDTRNELEVYKETHKLPMNLEGIAFSLTRKFEMAASFDKYVSGVNIELINDERQIRQILLVDCNLQAVETPEGHGDSFWSIALACYCSENLVGTRARTVGVNLGGGYGRRDLF